MKKAVRKLTSRKTGGVCGIHVEMVKVGGCTVVQKHLTELLQVPGPQEWKEAIIVPVCVKGCREQSVAFTRNKSTERGGEDLCEGGL